jgi:hypothetical protein
VNTRRINQIIVWNVYRCESGSEIISLSLEAICAQHTQEGCIPKSIILTADIRDSHWNLYLVILQALKMVKGGLS